MNEQSAEKSSTAYEMWMLICFLILIKWFIFLFAYIRKLCKPYQEFCWGPAADQANKTTIRTEERAENKVEFQTLLLYKQYKNKCLPGMTPLAPGPPRAKPEPKDTGLPMCHWSMQLCHSWSDSGVLPFWLSLAAQPAQQYCTRQWLSLPEWK